MPNQQQQHFWLSLLLPPRLCILSGLLYSLIIADIVSDVGKVKSDSAKDTCVLRPPAGLFELLPPSTKIPSMTGAALVGREPPCLVSPFFSSYQLCAIKNTTSIYSLLYKQSLHYTTSLRWTQKKIGKDGGINYIRNWCRTQHEKTGEDNI